MRIRRGIIDRAGVGEASTELSMGQLLAITVPIAVTICSVAWAMAIYSIVRESKRARIEIARLRSVEGR